MPKSEVQYKEELKDLGTVAKEFPTSQETLKSIDDKIVKADTDNVKVVSMPPISVTLEEKGFSNASDTPTRALVDTDRNVVVALNKDNVGLAKESTLSSIDSKIIKADTDNVSVTNFPSDYPDSTTHSKLDTLHTDITSDQPRHITNAYDSSNDRLKVDAQVVANPSNLDVALSTRASESTLSSIDTKLTNRSSFVTGVITITAGTPQQLPDQAVPSHFGVVIKAHDDNSGTVFIGNSSSTATSSSGFSLKASQGLKLYVDNLNRIWVDGDTDGDKVVYAVEV